MLVGVLASVGGLVVASLASYRATVAPGSTIVLLALLGFAVTWPIGVWLRHREPTARAVPRRSCPTSTWSPTSTRTSTGPTAATSRSPHGDHVDYVHDGHRHATARRAL